MNAWVTTNHIGLRLLPFIWALYFLETFCFLQYYPYHSRPHQKHLVLKVLGDQPFASKCDTGIPRFIPGNCTWFSSCVECNGHCWKRVCGHGSPTRRNNTEELGEWNGGANEIGQIKNRHRKRARPSCGPWLYGYQRWKWQHQRRRGWQRWHGREYGERG